MNSVVHLLLLAARCPSRCSLTPFSQRDGGENKIKNSWAEIKAIKLRKAKTVCESRENQKCIFFTSHQQAKPSHSLEVEPQYA